jgi:hypothetical protein
MPDNESNAEAKAAARAAAKAEADALRVASDKAYRLTMLGAEDNPDEAKANEPIWPEERRLYRTRGNAFMGWRRLELNIRRPKWKLFTVAAPDMGIPNRYTWAADLQQATAHVLEAEGFTIAEMKARGFTIFECGGNDMWGRAILALAALSPEDRAGLMHSFRVEDRREARRRRK